MSSCSLYVAQSRIRPLSYQCYLAPVSVVVEIDAGNVVAVVVMLVVVDSAGHWYSGQGHPFGQFD